ncbi:hypothetical protein [Sphingomonas cavernae]|uniref:Uncharacterized protein n=1 Tax=Sphingomonas cavernae TaxID=2320861 RepID=A0A418W6L8_9SPHN|nr:hypothetical protein [Sphingomonas cavernae]RJF85681.1 hypothetical protein D3876_17425 [Sphingomonas cavernae]
MRWPALLFPIAALASAPAAAQAASEQVGLYEAQATEIAAAIDLRADGRFRYGLSYGALDEEGEGVWTVESGTIYLTSDPKVTPPRFALERDVPAPAGTLTVQLSDPEALGGYPLTLIVTIAGEDRPRYVDAEEDGRVPLEPGMVVTSVVPDMPVYEIPYQPHALTPDVGHNLVFRFEPNDFGKADFAREPVAIRDSTLVLERYGRTIPFHRQQR